MAGRPSKLTRAQRRLREHARRETHRAIRRGDISLPYRCERCGTSDGPLDIHHHDYGDPLHVERLCRACHAKEHRREDTLRPRNIMIRASQWERLRYIAHRDNRSISELIREAIESQMDEAA